MRWLVDSMCMLLALLPVLIPTRFARADYSVDFEGAGETKTAYASGTVTLSGLDWNLTEALIGGGETGDWKQGLRSARLRGYGTSAMSMLENKTGGLGTLGFLYRRYGTDTQVDWLAEYSTDNGVSWTQVGSDFTAPADDAVQTFSETVNVTRGVRIRIKRATETGTSNNRLCIDDITLTDYYRLFLTGTPSAFSTTHGNASAAQTFTVSGQDLTSGITNTVPTGFELSTNNTEFVSSLVIPHGGGSVPGTPLYVRMTGAALGAFAGNLIASSANTATHTLALAGTVTLAAPVALPASATNQTGFTAAWNSVSGADAYRLDVSETASFTTGSAWPESFDDLNAAASLSGYSNRVVVGTSEAVTGLNPETTYYYRVRATQSDPDTVSPNSAIREVTTLAPSSSSDIARAGDFTEPSTIAYADTRSAGTLTDGNSLKVAQFVIRDGGAGNDADALATTLTNLVITIEHHACLRRIAIFDGSANLAEVATAALVTFSDFSLEVPDDGTKAFDIRVTFADGVTDNAQLRFSVSAASADPTGSTFAAGDAGGAASSTEGDRNRIAVTATKLVLESVPATVDIDSDFAVTVRAIDMLDNLDLDAIDSVTITRGSGEGTLVGGGARNLAAGAWTFAALQMDTPGAFSLRAEAAALADAMSGDIEAGETLAAGDLTIIGYRTRNPDGFAFAAWKHIHGGTVLWFTDSGFFSDGTMRDSEDVMSWTAPAGGIAAGTVVVLSCPADGAADANIGMVAGTSMKNLATDGDQVFIGLGAAFPATGDTTPPGASYSGTLLYGLNTHAPWLTEGAVDSANKSHLPVQLQGEYENQAFVTARNNGQYIGSRASYATWGDYKAQIHNPANWARENDGETEMEATPFVFGALADEPDAQAAQVTFPDVLPLRIRVAWNHGGGVGRLVVCREGEAPDAPPLDGIAYAADARLGGSGATLGGGQVVYAGTNNTVLITGLEPETVYHVQVFEYNGAGGMVNYLTHAASGNPARAMTPPGPNVMPGNLLVYTVDGQGSGLDTRAAAVTILEYTRSGERVGSIAMPFTGEGVRLTASGSAASEGKLTVSPNGAYAAWTGYDAEAGVGAVAGTANRTIARLRMLDGDLDLTTTGALGGDANARAVAMDQTGTNVWAVLHGNTTGTSGIRYLALGQTTTGEQLVTSNVRGVRLFGGNLHQWSAATEHFGIYQVGSGLPVEGGQTLTGLPGLSAATDNKLDAYGFFMADLNSDLDGYDTLWMARGTFAESNRGVAKYSKVDGTWQSNNTVTVGSGAYHIDGLVEDGVVHLYVVQGTGAGNTILHLADDSGYSQPMTGSLTTLATAETGQAFRGVAVIPSDADADGLPDWWELGYFGDLTATDGTLRPDGVIPDLHAYWAGTDPTDSSDIMRLLDLDLADEAGDDVRVTFHGGAHRTFAILGSAQPNAPGTLLGKVTSGAGSGAYTFTDTDAVKAGDRRFYTLAAVHEEGSYTNVQEWAMFAQPRLPGRKYLVSVPVDYGDGNTLDGPLGAHLARGLKEGALGETDTLRVLDGHDGFVTYELAADGEGGRVWTLENKAATAAFQPGQAFWIYRTESVAVRSNMVFVGRTRTNTIAPVAMTVNGASQGWRWNTFGWPYSEPVSNTADPNPFGLAALGYGGRTGRHNAPHENRGDELWVFDWDTQAWERFWLTGEGLPVAGGLWWSYADATNGVFALEPGRGYYYRHHSATNGETTGTNFLWTPQMP